MSRTRFQTGRLTQAGKGLRRYWKGEWYVYVIDADGKEQRKHRTENLGLVPRVIDGQRAGVEKAEAYTALQQWVAKETQDTPRPSAQVTFADFFRRCYLPLKINWKHSTRLGNIRLIEAHILKPLGALPLANLTKPMLQAHLVQLADEDYSRSLIEKVRVYLHASLEEAVEQDFLRKNPARGLQIPNSTRESCKRFLTPEEIMRLLAVTEGRDRLIFRLFLVCGFRPGELLSLRWEDITGTTIRVDETLWCNVIGTPKTKASNASVPMPQSLAAEIEEWRALCDKTGPKDWVFPNRVGGHPWYTTLYEDVLAPVRVAANIPDLTFQALRRTCATYLYTVGNAKDAQAVLRHAKPDLTAGTYIQPIAESVRAAVEAWDKKMTPANVVPIRKKESA